MLDTLYARVQEMPWDRSPHPGTMAVWTLLVIGGLFAVLTAADLLHEWKRKRPR